MLSPSRYLSQDDVLDQSNPFVQLVSGVVWLLRNGEVYINQSLMAECDKTQETGTRSNIHFHRANNKPLPVGVELIWQSEITGDGGGEN